MITLAEKMKVLEDLHDQYNVLEQEIKDEVMALGQSQQVGRVKATFYPNGQGKWDWESIAKFLEPDDELIEQFTETKVIVKWNKIAEKLAGDSLKTYQEDSQFKGCFYTTGNPFVAVSVK